jgi:hypothetical protein
MKQDTDTLIASLADGLEPTPARGFAAKLAMWLACAAGYVAVLLAFLGVRPDLLLKMHSFLFAGEIMLLALIVISCALSAMVLSFPDMQQKRYIVFLPVVPVALFVGLLAVSWLHDTPPSPEPLHGFECLRCIALFSLLPVAGLLLLMRRQATTHSLLAGAVAMLAASSLGCLTLRLSEDTDSIAHIVKWHYLPIMAFCILGMWCGKKALKW